MHDFRQGFRESLAEPGGAERLADALAANPPVEHPVVARHPVSGEQALYVNSLFTTHIKGMTARESRAILQMLYAHLIEPEFTVRLCWAPRTLAIWDNRSTQHKPVNDYFPAHRRMHRVTIEGDVPSAALVRRVTTVVTGSTGHLGEALVRTLRADGESVIGVDMRPGPYTDRVGRIEDIELPATP